MEKRNKIILITAVIIIITLMAFVASAPLKKQVIPAKFRLGDKPGFDLTPQQLTFGQVTNETGTSRGISIENNFDKTVKISIEAKGEIKKNIVASENDFTLDPHEVKNISFFVHANGLTEFRDYVGEVIIITRKA